MREHLAGRRRVAGAQRVAMAELQPVDAELVGQLVHHRLVGDGGLRHAEAAEGAGRRAVGEEGLAPGAHVGHGIRAHGMDRHAIGDGRPPGGIGAGVEVAVTSQASSLPSASQPNFARRCAPDGAWSWRPCSRAACRRSAPAGRASRPRARSAAAPRDRACRRSRRRRRSARCARPRAASRMTIATSSRSM